MDSSILLNDFARKDAKSGLPLHELTSDDLFPARRISADLPELNAAVREAMGASRANNTIGLLV